MSASRKTHLSMFFLLGVTEISCFRGCSRNYPDISGYTRLHELHLRAVLLALQLPFTGQVRPGKRKVAPVLVCKWHLWPKARAAFHDFWVIHPLNRAWKAGILAKFLILKKQDMRAETSKIRAKRTNSTAGREQTTFVHRADKRMFPHIP